MDTKELYSQLENLREKLRVKFTTNGKAPLICSDETLNELAKRAPRQKDDLLGIGGIGQTFVEKYGDYFMQFLNAYHRSNISTRELKQEVKNTLKNLENRLVNISKRNRLLYMGILYNKYAVDLYSENESFNTKVLDLLMGKTSSISVSSKKSSTKDDEENKKFTKINALIREIEKECRETGIYDLYIGYPYVRGNTKGEDFSVRAPLVLFPVQYTKNLEKIVIKIDKTKDILFNNNFILMQNKFLNDNSELPNNVLEEDFIKKGDFYDNIVEFYSAHNIDIQDDDLDNLVKFQEYAAKDFPKYNNGEFLLENCAILGKFSLYSSALQRDYKKMIDSEDINSLLDDLLANIDTIDTYSDNFLEEEQTNNTQIQVSEKDINYINELNSSQEQAILNVDYKNKLVIQGPPGTGKSQTIASLIADAVNKGKNVLMVSQKKAALDVIYSRLGTLSSYAVLLSDVKNKEAFYKQLKNLFHCDKDPHFNNEEFNEVSAVVDDKVNNLEAIKNLLFVSKFNNCEMYKIYQEGFNNYFIANRENLDAYYDNVSDDLLDADYLLVKVARDKFNNSHIVSDCITYFNLAKENAWLDDVKDNLTQLEINKMKDSFKTFIKEQTEYLSLNIFKKLTASFKRHSAINKLYKTYFKTTTSKKQIYKNPQILSSGINHYIDFKQVKYSYDLLSDTEKLYVKSIYNLVNNNVATLEEANSKIFDFITYCIIQDFEHRNRQVLFSINNFNNIVQDINDNMNNKKELTKNKFENLLVRTFNRELYNSKRYNEISRLVESSRKWSINKFIERFDFELFKGIKIWLMTPETVSEVLPLEYGLFDLLIFDEASQIYIEKGLPAITRAKKVVIAGDHKQLRPSSLGSGRIDNEEDETSEDDEELNAALEEESLLDLARFKYPNVMLNYHYRSRYEELINFSNYAFYDGKLNISPNTEEPPEPPIEVVKIDNGLWQNRTNKQEALRVVKLIKSILTNRKNKETLGVITFNSNQRDLILDEIDKECLKDRDFSLLCKNEFERKENGEDIGLFVKNIENVQGDERDCIIFSTGYAKNEAGKIVRNFGWLNQIGGENRLNVAISRAKKKIYLVTSITPQELNIDDLKNEGPKLFKKYLEYCWAINNKDKQVAKQILYSLIKSNNQQNTNTSTNLEREVLKALTEKGLKVETQVGVGNYKLDLAILNPENSKYVLGIEFDNKLYTNNTTTRERDIFRLKYFKARGWNIYRLWSTNWWHNKEQEIENIIKTYNSICENKIKE